MAKRTIDHTGRDMTSKQEKQVPVWHAIVGPDHEPVLIGEPTCLGEEVLTAEGWVPDSNSGFIYAPDFYPRRRRKEVTVFIEVSSQICRQGLRAKTGDQFRVNAEGQLIPVDTEGQVQR